MLIKLGKIENLEEKKLPNFKLEAIRIEIKAIAIKMKFNVNNDFKCYLLGILKTDQIIIVLVL